MRSLVQTSALLAVVQTVSAFDCHQVVSNRVTWDLKPLAGPHVAHFIKSTPPSHENYTFTIDICAPLKPSKDVPKEYRCNQGTRICGQKWLYRNDTDKRPELVERIPIAGDYGASHGNGIESYTRRLRDSDSNSESGKEGVEVELRGGKVGKNRQKAIITFLCNREKTGLEGENDEEEAKAVDRSRRSARAAEDDGEGFPDPDEGRSLKVLSYNPEVEIQGDLWGVLRLQWETKYACEDARDHAAKGGWGFFTWLIIIIFLATSAYLVFGSWLNYNRYGARGWDLLPHGDTIRDIPYIAKDWGRRVVSTLQGSGSRGGYSAL